MISELSLSEQVDRRYWLDLAEDPVLKVIHEGHLYLVFDPDTMADTGSRRHAVQWLDAEKPSGEYRLMPQGLVPDWIRDRLADNVAQLQYLD